jgi:polysaccharide pyruvyl transferase WcaK-like protein
MLAGFLAAMRSLSSEFSCTASVPFPLEPLRTRFPEIKWHPYDEAIRSACIASCDAWVGLGGSPFQSLQSRWFIDHLIREGDLCRRHGKPMFYLGVGVQTQAELAVADVRNLVASAVRIWTRDAASASRLEQAGAHAKPGADLAHLFLRDAAVPAAAKGRMTVVPNFDFERWPGMEAFLQAAETVTPAERVWLAQESRPLPGAERMLHATLDAAGQQAWRLVVPDAPGTALNSVMPKWPSGEWLVTSRFHAALAGAWAGSKVVVIATNEKLAGVAKELGAPTLRADATATEVERALAQATVSRRPVHRAAEALANCRELCSAVCAS